LALGIILDINYYVASPFTPQRYLDEMKGMADGSKGVIDYTLLRRINFLPELSKAHCTVVGAWGPATIDGKIYHLRSLDWDFEAPV
jgi:hypothetical protein